MFNINDNLSLFFFNNMLFSFIQQNYFYVSFFVTKKKTFIKHQKKFFDKINTFFVKIPQSKFIYFKFLKIIFLKKFFKKRLLIFMNRELFTPLLCSYREIFQHLIFELFIEKRQH